jgi:hypothetical protein
MLIPKNSICLSAFIILTVLVLSAVTPAIAEDVGKITFLDGRVDIVNLDQDVAIPLETGAPVSLMDIVRTKSNARAEITLNDGTVVRLAQSTRIGLTSSSTLHLMRGRIRTIIPNAAEGLEVRTPNAIAMTNGTDYYFIYEKGSSWFYGADGVLQAFSIKDRDNIVLIKNRKCIRIAPGIPVQNSCVFKDIDVEKYAWDTSTSEKTPVVATLPTEKDVYTYTPVGGRAVETPSLPVPIAFEDLACPQCPPEDIPLDLTTTPAGPKMRGDFREIEAPPLNQD